MSLCESIVGSDARHDLFGSVVLTMWCFNLEEPGQGGQPISIICQGISGRRPSFLAIHAKLAKKNTSTFWGFEPGTNFCKKIEPGTKNFAIRNRYR